MKKLNQKRELDTGIYDPNPRRVLKNYEKEIKEKPIETGLYREEQKLLSPAVLALSIMLGAQNHLNLILDNCTKIGLEINKEQKTKLYLEFLSLYYFLIGTQIDQYFKEEDQFMLFVLRVHVELLDNLPQTRDTWWLFGLNPFTRSKRIKEIVGERSWMTGLSGYINEGERFYIKDKLNKDETEEINELRQIFLGSDQSKYEQNLLIQFIIKNSYLVSKILNLSLPKDITFMTALYSINSIPILETYKEIIQYIKPAWQSEKQ